MKKLFFVLAFVFLMAQSAWAVGINSIGNTTDAAITTGTGYLKGVIVHTDGTNGLTMSVYDNSSTGSGTKLFSTWTILTSSTNRTSYISFEGQECPYTNGIFVDITISAGTVTYDVFFEPK